MHDYQKVYTMDITDINTASTKSFLEEAVQLMKYLQSEKEEAYDNTAVTLVVQKKDFSYVPFIVKCLNESNKIKKFLDQFASVS